MLTDLVAVLERLGVRSTAVDLADLLWLAEQLDPPEAFADEVTPSTPPLGPEEELFGDDDEPLLEERTGEEDVEVEENTPLVEEPTSDLHSATTNDDSPESMGASRGATPFPTPAAFALPHSRAISRALRPLLRRIPSHTRFALDETATAEHTAQAGGLLAPVLRPLPDRWLDVAVVVEQSSSMVIWQETMAEFLRLLAQLGAFRTLRVWHLVADEAGTVGLYAPGHTTRHSPRELIAPNGRCLILVVTDGVSGSWGNGKAQSLLAEWRKTNLVTFIHLLPAHFWERTPLGQGLWVQVQTASATTAPPNSQLAITYPWTLEETERPPEPTPYPVVPLQAPLLAFWAKLVAGNPHIAMPALIWAGPRVESASPVEIAPEERLAIFWQIASPLARELAVYLAAAPLTLPLMRLVQRVMLPQAEQTHLAEFFLSGLIRRQEEAEAEPLYDFLPGLRDILIGRMPVFETMDVLEKVFKNLSAFIDEHTGQLMDFRTWLMDETAVERMQVTGLGRPFARVALQTLRRLGGEYAELAARLAQKLHLLPKTRTIPSQKDTTKFSKRILFDRKADLAAVNKLLRDHPILVIYGLSGIGKTRLIDAVIPKGTAVLPLNVYPNLQVREWYAELLRYLDKRTPNPKPLLTTDVLGGFPKLASYKNTAPETTIRIANAHSLFNATGFINRDIPLFLQAIARHLPQFTILLESQEAPPQALDTNLFPIYRLQGLTEAGVRQFFQSPFPQEPDKGWQFNDQDGHYLFARLAGKQDKANPQKDFAHPAAMVLLAALADRSHDSPIAILRQYPQRLVTELRAQLFDAFYQRLSPADQRALQLCALYREAIPYQHIERINAWAKADNAFANLYRYCLLDLNDNEDKYILHPLMGELIRDQANDMTNEAEAHAYIAQTWRTHFTRTLIRPNLSAVAEAAYHLTQAGRYDLLAQLPRELLHNHAHDLIPYLSAESERLHRAQKYRDNFHVLEVWLLVDEYDDRPHRFMGETLEKLRGRGDEEALSHYLQAYKLNPMFQPYLTYIGRCLLARQEPARFVALIAQRANGPLRRVLDIHGIPVYARCLEQVGRGAEASQIRQSQIKAKVQNVAIYNDEAVYWQRQGAFEKAWQVLELARTRGLDNEFTRNIRAKVLEGLGRGAEASDLRQAQIAAGEKNVVVYADEADYWHKQGAFEKAWQVLELARTRGLDNDFTRNIRAKVLEGLGRGEEASDLRQALMADGVRDVVVYADEALYLGMQKQYAQALACLDKAEALGLGNEVTDTMRATILRHQAGAKPLVLHTALATRFSLGELAVLCADLGEKWEDVRGETLPEQAAELVAFMERRGKTAALLARLRQLRPHYTWPDE